ncbi:MAG TPA: aminotransferase class V-fold PLP-dependent enzyme [Candidatus Limnocylindria bacterium]|nr:aminotransferase class V-fold PLP-dependent enzyme [Candidatus Limnocylindria bacterium]
MTFIDDRPDLSARALQALDDDFLYFNVAGSGPTFPVAQRAAERYRAWLNGVAMFSHVGYDSYNAELAATREALASFVGGDAGSIALMQSATDGLNTLVSSLRLAAGALVVTTEEEHPSALLPVYRRQDRGDAVRVLPYADDSSFLEATGRAFVDGAVAIVLSLVSCRTGRVLPVAEVCRQARAAGAISIVDCAQALGQIGVDVRSLGMDAAVFLGHKWMHGPLATGAIWVRDPERWAPDRVGWRSRETNDFAGHMTLHPDGTRFETGTVDAAAFVGLRQAILVHQGLGPTVGERVRSLRERLLQALSGLPLELLGQTAEPTGIVVVRPRGGDAAGIVRRLWDDERIVVKLIDESDAIRISFWALHREPDIDRLAATLAAQLAVPA